LVFINQHNNFLAKRIEYPYPHIAIFSQYVF